MTCLRRWPSTRASAPAPPASPRRSNPGSPTRRGRRWPPGTPPTRNASVTSSSSAPPGSAVTRCWPLCGKDFRTMSLPNVGLRLRSSARLPSSARGRRCARDRFHACAGRHRRQARGWCPGFAVVPFRCRVAARRGRRDRPGRPAPVRAGDGARGVPAYVRHGEVFRGARGGHVLPGGNGHLHGPRRARPGRRPLPRAAAAVPVRLLHLPRQLAAGWHDGYMGFELTEQIERHLIGDQVAWLTTVTPSGWPAPRPVWFVWDGSAITIYSLNSGVKQRHIAVNDKVSLHFDAGPGGGDIVVIYGRAELVPGAPPPSRFPGLLDKYLPTIEAMGSSAQWFDDEYGVSLRVTPERAWAIP